MKLIALTIAINALLSCSGRNRSLNADAVSSFSQVAHDTVSTLSKNIMTIFQDSKENYWFGSWEDGLYKYDGSTILHFTTKSGLPANRVEEIKEDAQGTIYINTSGGVCKFIGNEILVLEAIESDDWKIESGDLWFKTSNFDGKLLRYDGQVLHSLTLPTTNAAENWIAKHPNTPSPCGIYTVYKDSRGFIWFGTAAAGACRFNGSSFDWISEDDVTEFHYGPSNGVRSIAEDKDGYFWFNTAFRYKVYDHIDDHKKTFYTREKSIGNLDKIEDSQFCEYLSIAPDNNDHLWIVSYNAGVYRYDGTSIKHYPVQINGADITHFYIYKDQKGHLWLGTHENGVLKFNGNNFEPFNP